MTAFDVVILAGGRGERLGGVDKGAVVLDGITLLERVVAAAAEATQVICVGPERDTSQQVRWTREEPPGGGPVAAIAAGLDLVEAPIVVILAVDLPFVTPRVVSQLVNLCEGSDGALVVDGDGIEQPLLAAYRVDRLRTEMQSLESLERASMMSLIDGLNRVTATEPEAARDVDTPADLESSHSLFDRRR